MLALAAFPRQTAPQDNLRRETIVRNDTVTQIDTIITTKKIKRTEVIRRTEEVYYSDSIVSKNGSAAINSFITNVETGAASKGIGIDNPGGGYIWIPDSLKEEVALIINGGGRARNNVADTVYVERMAAGGAFLGKKAQPFDPNEKVTFRGDTVNMVLRSRNLGRFDRGLFNYLYIPKGIWSIGVTASYGEFSTKDLEVLDLMSDINFSGHIFSIRPYFSYFIRNNQAVGMRLGYTSGKAKIGSLKVDIDDDMNFNLKDISYRSETYTAAITYSQYFGIMRRGRFSIFNDVELAFSSGNSDFTRPFNGKLKNTHTNTMEVALNFSPGLSIYVMDPVTFNVSFGVFGVSLRNEKQTVDGVDMGSRFTSGANFRFNIFNISFGVAVNL